MQVKILNNVFNKKKNDVSVPEEEITSLDIKNILKEVELPVISNPTDEEVNELFKTINSNNYNSFVDETLSLIEREEDDYNIINNAIIRYDKESCLYPNSFWFWPSPTHDVKIACIYNKSNIFFTIYKTLMEEIHEIRKEVNIRYKAFSMFVEEEKNISKKSDYLLSYQDKIKSLSDIIDHKYSNIIMNLKKSKILKERKRQFSNVEKLLNEKDHNTHINVARALDISLGCFECYNIPRELKVDLYKELENVIYKIEGEKYCKDYIGGYYEGQIITKETIKSHFEHSFTDNIMVDSKWKWLTFHCSNEVLNEITKILVDIIIKRDRYRKEHFHDYKNYIEQMDVLIDKYNNTILTEWNLDELEKEITELCQNIGDYLRIFGEGCVGNGSFHDEEEVDKKIINEINKRFFTLTFFYGLIYGENKVRILLEELNDDIHPYGFHYYDGYDYYDKYIKELKKQVEEKYHIKFSVDTTYIDEDVIYNRNLEISREFMLLLEGKEDHCADIYFKKDKEVNLNDFIDECVKFNNLSTSYTYEKMTNPGVYNVSYIEELSLEEIYYIIKYLILSNGEFEFKWVPMTNVYYKSDYEIGEFCIERATNILMKLQKTIIENKYDSRILVIPKNIKFDSLNVTHLKGLKKTDNYNPFALYVSTYSQLEKINRFYYPVRVDETEKLTNLNNLFDYILIDEETYNKVLNEELVLIDDIKERLRVIPKINSYSEISNYLDIELEKDSNNKKLVKSK